MAWLVAAALVLVLLAGLCVATEVAFIRISRAGGRELTRGRKRRGTGGSRPCWPMRRST
jgi:CBS domain containing-hemolysin-like protein